MDGWNSSLYYKCIKPVQHEKRSCSRFQNTSTIPVKPIAIPTFHKRKLKEIIFNWRHECWKRFNNTRIWYYDDIHFCCDESCSKSTINLLYDLVKEFFSLVRKEYKQVDTIMDIHKSPYSSIKRDERMKRYVYLCNFIFPLYNQKLLVISKRYCFMIAKARRDFWAYS